ncbi:MAG: GTP-binding protein, partial [Armatimonadetes bacterium]|nr:GTP-binding protein [Armatimonadota bacterium]
MPPHTTAQIRNIVLIGHRGSGKTSLAEALLFDSGMTSRLGSVEQGNTVCDADPEEAERGISIMTALCYAEYGDHKINIVDTPGYAEFVAEVAYGIWVADVAGLVIDASAGVEVHTRRVYAMARERSLPMIAIVNKMDKERADFFACIDSMREALYGCVPVPVQVPVGAEADFKGVVDLLTMRAYLGKGNGVKQTEVPDEVADAVNKARVQMIEAVVETNDELLEKYLSEEEITADELKTALRQGLIDGRLVPVVATSATQDIGGVPLLEFVASVCPSPAELKPWRGTLADSDQEAAVAPDPDEPFCAFIFKTLTDPYVGRISFLRVVGGMARADANVVVGATGRREKCSGLAVAQGRKTQQTGELWPGDLGCVTRLEEARTGDTLCDPRRRVVFPRPQLPQPMYSLAVRGASRQDEDKLGTALERAADEDVGFHYERSADTGELVVSGMGPLHLETVISRLQRQFQVQVQL